MRSDTANIQDRAAVGLRSHERREDLAAEVRCEQATIDDFMPLVVGNLLVRNGRIRSGTVDQHVHLAIGRDRRVEQSLDAEALIGRHWQERRLSTQRLDRFDALMPALLAAPGDDDASAGLRQAITQRPAEHTRAANYDSDLIIEAKEMG